MNAIHQAAELYRDKGMNLSGDIEKYLAAGYVISSPEVFVLFRPINKADPNRWIPYNEGDAWFVGLFSGNGLNRVIENMPYYLPFVTWYRGFKKDNDRLHVWETSKLVNKLRGNTYGRPSVT